ncbi:MAG: HEAT repeat domain-containing protein [Desulfobacteraceae bacterium]|nr:HEAT repeat domain-containing protein [Desulfobacteraceae bacterium]
MPDFTDQDLLDEIRFDIKARDRRKAELVLAALKDVQRDTQKKALFEVSRADEEFSIPLLAGLFVNAPDIAKSFPQLKETMYSKMLSRPDVLRELLLKEANPNVRAFLAEVAGQIQLAEAAPALMDMIGSESDPGIIGAAIISLGMIGDPRAVAPVSAFLQHPDKALASAAVDTLGKIASPEAIQKLADCLGKDPELDHKMIDIFSKVQTPEAIENLNKTLGSEHAHVRSAGKEKLGAIGVMSVRVLLKNLNRLNSDLVIHSLNVLGDIGDVAAVTAIRNLLNQHPEDANVRFAAYEALGRLPLEKGAFALASGLEDPVDNVRSAAARAIDRNYNALLAGGVRNMIKASDGAAALIMEAVVNSQCERIFVDLLEEEKFKASAMAYLSAKAHPDIRAFFTGILTAKGFADLATLVAPKAGEKTRASLRIYTVDDSKMLLNIYRSVLHNLGCEAMAFESPAQALERVREDKPDVILTDLNMPQLTGIDLAKGIRTWFPKEQLPIILVTTQQESQDFKDVQAVGINGIIQKPFTESHISAALKKYAGYDAAKNHGA